MSQKVKKSQEVLLIPGAGGWEVWTSAQTEEFTLAQASAVREALAVEGVPNGNLTMAFPVRDVSATPFLAATGEKAMFRDLAELHLERSGLRSGDASGSLTDCFTLWTSEEEALLLPVVLSAPPEGGLPRKSPKAFDVSARCFPMPGDSVVLWREFGRWVFAVSDDRGQPLYFQALPGALFDQQLTREVSLGVAQLEIQQVLRNRPQNCIVWNGEDEIAPSEESLTALEQALGMTVSSLPKPSPRFPEVMSQLLPSDIRAERVAKQKSRQIKLAIAAGVIVYLGAVGSLVWKLQMAKEAQAIAEAEVLKTSPLMEEVVSFNEKWKELQPIVENEFWPIELYYQVYQAAPKTGLSITRAEMTNELEVKSGGEQALKRGIKLLGESQEAGQAVQFGENLQRSSYFENFIWSTPSPSQTNTGTWSFSYTATPIDAAS